MEEDVSKGFKEVAFEKLADRQEWLQHSSHRSMLHKSTAEAVTVWRN